MSALSYFQDSFIQKLEKNDIGIVIYDSHDFGLFYTKKQK